MLLFFFVSGYLIAKLLTETYSGRAEAFIRNRFLRIYPIYWACALFGLAIVAIIPEVAVKTNKAMTLPSNGNTVFANLFIFGLNGSAERILPPAWSLHVELVWYCLLFILYTGFRNLRLLLLVAFLPLPVIWAVFYDAGFYGSWIASGYAFALGALRYETNFNFPKPVEFLALAAVPVILFATPLMFDLSGGNPADLGSWFNLWVAPFVMFVGFGVLLKEAPETASSSWAGSLSYPVFLVHWPCAALATKLGASWGAERFVWATILTLIVSVVIVLYVEHPLKKKRDAIRAAKA